MTPVHRSWYMLIRIPCLAVCLWFSDCLSPSCLGYVLLIVIITTQHLLSCCNDLCWFMLIRFPCLPICLRFLHCLSPSCSVSFLLTIFFTTQHHCPSEICIPLLQLRPYMTIITLLVTWCKRYHSWHTSLCNMSFQDDCQMQQMNK